LTVPENDYYGRRRYIPPPPRDVRERYYDHCWRDYMILGFTPIPFLSGRETGDRYAGKHVLVGADRIPYQLLLSQLELLAAEGARSVTIDESRAPFLEVDYWPLN
jgi:hypothetical protein